MSKINLNKNTKYLHFEDNEVSELDAAGEVLDSKKFKTAKAARAAFSEQVQSLELAEDYRYDYVFYQPEFPPQRIEITRK